MSEDDWETADLSSGLSEAKAKSKLSLRAGAPTFSPRPATSSSGDAGPSRQSPATTPYIARPALYTQDEPKRSSPLGSSGGDEWFRGPKPASNRQIWDAANNHLPSPLPTAIGSPSIALASPIPQPGITILRRQPGGAEKKRGGGTQTPPKTMEEREEEYRLARERIFGGSSAATTAGQGGIGEPSRSNSNGGRARTPTQAVAGWERTIPPAGRLYDEFTGQPGLSPVPVQAVRRSPAPGILRQPMGPGEGGGFGR